MDRYKHIIPCPFPLKECYNKRYLEFIADNTNVEWGYYSTSGGTYGRLITSNSGVSARTLPEYEAKKFNEFYHSHPVKVEHEGNKNKGSENDIKYAKELEEYKYSNIGIYDAKTKKYIYYDSDKEDFM